MPTCLLCLIWAMFPIALSMADEASLGRDFMRAMRDAGDVLDDAEVNDYINTLGHRLSASVRIPACSSPTLWSTTSRSTPLPCRAAMWG
jgi:predicted Zn-dependent protease